MTATTLLLHRQPLTDRDAYRLCRDFVWHYPVPGEITRWLRRRQQNIRTDSQRMSLAFAS